MAICRNQSSQIQTHGWNLAHRSVESDHRHIPFRNSPKRFRIFHSYRRRNSGKTLLFKHAARTFDAITEVLGNICELFSPRECHNYFKAVGIEAN